MLLSTARGASDPPPPPQPPPDSDYAAVELRLRTGAGAGTVAELRVENHPYPEAMVSLDRVALDAVGPDPAAYGEALGRQLLDGTTLGAQLAEVRTALAAQGKRWRLRLRIDDDALNVLRWETLHLPNDGNAWSPIGADAGSPFSRFIYADWTTKRPLVERPISALLVIASPAGLGDYGVEHIPDADRAAVRDALGAAARGQLQTEELSTGGTAPTHVALRSALTRAPAIVHVLCHGLVSGNQTALLLETKDGQPDPVLGEHVIDCLRGADPRPRLVVLSACASATSVDADAFRSLATDLANAGVDAVIAMTGPVSADTARQFCTHLYERLLAHGVVDRAVNEARAAVRGEWDWGVPVLFSRLADAQLLDFPVGRVDAEYLEYSNRLARLATRATEHGRLNAAHDAVDALTALVAELEKSHGVVAEWGGRFRRVGADPATFADAFRAFYNDFKDYYDNETFLNERTSCQQVGHAARYAMPLVREALTADEVKQVEEDLGHIVGADGTIIEHLTGFLDTMDREVEEIQARLLASDTAGAIARKQAFEMQLSPSFRRSKQLLGDIGVRAHRVSAA